MKETIIKLVDVHIELEKIRITYQQTYLFPLLAIIIGILISTFTFRDILLYFLIPVEFIVSIILVIILRHYDTLLYLKSSLILDDIEGTKRAYSWVFNKFVLYVIRLVIPKSHKDILDQLKGALDSSSLNT